MVYAVKSQVWQITPSGSRKYEEFEMGDLAVAQILNGLTASQRMAQVQHTRFTLDAETISIVDSGTNGGHGGLKLLTFPEGRILIVAAMTDLALVGGGAGIVDDAAVVAALGTVVTTTANDALTTTEADIIASVAATLTADAGDFNGASAASGAILDGTAGAKSVFLNYAIPAADIAATDTMAATGTINIFWIYLGDD